MPIKFNKDLLDSHISKYNATLIGEYDKLTQNSRIKFQCKCGNLYDKQFKRLTISGALCESCTKINQFEKIALTAKQISKPSESYSKEVLDRLLNETGSKLNGELPPLKKEATIAFTCKCGIEDSKTFVRIKITGALCKICTMKQKREKQEKTNIQKYGTKHSFQNATVKKLVYKNMVQNFPCKIVLYRQKQRLQIYKNTELKFLRKQIV